MAHLLILLIPRVFTYLNGKYQGWNGTEQAIIGAADKATDGKDYGQETITDRSGFVCVECRD